MIQKKKKEYPPFTKELVVDGLRRLGLKRGDVVFVHSSLKDLAPATQLIKLPDMGMPYVVDGLKEVIGPAGIVAFPTFSFCFTEFRHPRPEARSWNKKDTPSRVGDITNYFLKTKGVERSDHPTHSVAAWGERAAEFVANHQWNAGTTFHRNGPWGKLCDWDGYILFFGTYMSTCTMVHVVEDWMKLPYLTEEEVLLRDENGVVRTATVTGSPSGCREFYNNRGTKVERRFLATDIYNSGKICMADVTLFKARDFVRFLWEALKEDPWLLLHRDPDDQFCWQAGQAAEKYLAEFNEPPPY